MLRLRPYRQNDAARIITWCQDERSFYQWTAGIMGEYPPDFERVNKATSGRIANESYFPFVAFDENGLVGFFTLRKPGEDEGELSFGYVIVAPEYRGKGCGKKMLRLGMKFAFEIYGARKLSLEVYENNKAARSCYKAVGFVENGSIEELKIMDETWKWIGMELYSSCPSCVPGKDEADKTRVID